MSTLSILFNRLKPGFKILPLRERLLCGLGALMGLSLSSLLSWFILGNINIWYIAPMGASSVLLFAVPASPLAQPWNIIVGNTLAGFLGVTCTLLIPNLTGAFSLAVALSIILMMSTDSLHPPSGAVAITAVLGGSPIYDLGYSFVVVPVLLNSILLLIIAIVFNQLLGKNYPYKASIRIRSADPTPTQKVTIRPSDVSQALEQQTELLDISEYDLQHLILQAQQVAGQRSLENLTCADLMNRDVLSLNSLDTLTEALEKFKQLNIMSLPVVNNQYNLIGTLALYDVMEAIKSIKNIENVWNIKVHHVMHYQIITAKAEQSIQSLIPYFVERSFNYIPVVEKQQLIGMLSRADIIAMLQQQLILEKNKK